MTLEQARILALLQSIDGSSRHVNATIWHQANPINDEYVVNPNAYRVGDWFDNSTVETYVNGERKW